jgi:glutamate-ammonia-ligase adenylyltransferase
MTSKVRFEPCGPVVDPAAAERIRGLLADAARQEGWGEALDAAWPALAPVFSASSYLAGLVRRRPARLAAILRQDPQERLADILEDTAAVGEGGDIAAAARSLRELKAHLHLMTALSDLGGLWDLDAVTRALTLFADAALAAALAVAVRVERSEGRMTGQGPLPGYFCIAMGKYGAWELNYSSDIDYSVFYHPERLPLAAAIEPAAFAIRLTQTVAQMLSDKTADGYVFRVDLRLRPDPSATPVAVPVDAALDYYETLGQNWERAAFIKARVCAGDEAAGGAFLAELLPFVWRKNLDYAAIADVHSIKRQIHVHKIDDRLDPRGADLKLGRGGIREIEFFVQTQQLILGGRDPSLRSFRTLDALQALTAAGHVTPAAAKELSAAYVELRALEHRAQMIADQQTHKLPEADPERKKIAALYGQGNLRSFDAAVRKLLVGVNRRYGELFAEDEDLSSRFGSLVFTGVEDDPETLNTLKRMGFSSPSQVAAAIRAWHHGRIGATRSERGRELFTRLAPRLLEAAHDSGAPDAAFSRFSEFFAGLSAGVQVQSLFLAQPRLFQLIVDVLALAPRLASQLARRPAALDALMDPGFFAVLDPAEIEQSVTDACARAEGYEEVMDAARRAHREQVFRIGVQLMGGTAGAASAGPAFTAIADGCIRALAPAALAETTRLGGAFPGEVAILALGKCGSAEMTATSDLDLMVLYGGHAQGAASEGKGWWAETFWGRFTQRLTSALSAPTAEGGLYEVDLKLRPNGADGPVAVSATAFADYYAGEAETWEIQSLTRARVVWASGEAFGSEASRLIEAALRRPRDRKSTARDVREMRALMEKERAAKGFWDLKLVRGGLVDVEFAAQFLQIVAAAQGGPLVPHTGGALDACAQAGLADPQALASLKEAWTLQQELSQILKVAFPGDVDPAAEPAGFRALLARAGGVRDLKSLTAKLVRLRAAAKRDYEKLVV